MALQKHLICLLFPTLTSFQLHQASYYSMNTLRYLSLHAFLHAIFSWCHVFPALCQTENCHVKEFLKETFPEGSLAVNHSFTLALITFCIFSYYNSYYFELYLCVHMSAFPCRLRPAWLQAHRCAVNVEWMHEAQFCPLVEGEQGEYTSLVQRGENIAHPSPHFDGVFCH